MASSAVHPVTFDDDDGGGGEALPGLTAPTADVPASPSPVWPSLSESDEEEQPGEAHKGGRKEEDGKNADGGGRITYPKVYDGGEGVEGKGEGEIRELAGGGYAGEFSGGIASSGVYDGDGDVIAEEDLDDVRAGSDEDAVLREVVSVLSAEEAEVLRGRLARSSASAGEGESSSGSVVTSSGRDLGDLYITQELPDDWLEVEDASSSLSNVVPEMHGIDDTPGRASNLRDTGSKRVYTFPKREEEVLPAAEEVGTQILAWPVGVVIEMIGFQMRLIMQMLSFALCFCSISLSVMTFPFRASLKATNVAVTTAVDGYTLATQIKPILEQGVAQVGPIFRQTTKKCGFGCLAAIYVMFVLGFLLVPALFLDLSFVRGFMDEPVEFRQILHFDYRQVL